MTHQPGVYVPLTALFLVPFINLSHVCTINYIGKMKALIWAFFFACAKSRFSHEVAQV